MNDLQMETEKLRGPWENLPYRKIAHFQISTEFCIGQLKIPNK